MANENKSIKSSKWHDESAYSNDSVVSIVICDKESSSNDETNYGATQSSEKGDQYLYRKLFYKCIKTLLDLETEHLKNTYIEMA